MLELRLTPSTDATWRWDGIRYVTDHRTSELEPFRHPMLEQLAVTDGQRTLLVVRERVAGRQVCDATPRSLSAAEYDRARVLATDWPADFVLVETAPRMPVHVRAGACATAPLYLAHDATTLYGSWDMANLRRQHPGHQLPGPSLRDAPGPRIASGPGPRITGLCAREAARLLIYRPRYGRETLFEGIHRLTERATAFYGGHLHIHYPEPALHGKARDLASGADVLGAFVQAIDTAMDLRPFNPASTVFNLTGGFDSGVVATRAAQRYPDQLHTAALLVGGPGRAQQFRRRKEIRAALPFGARDDIVDSMREAPLHPDCARARGKRISPYEEPLHYPFTRLNETLADHGTRTVFTGLGGDEMVALSQQEYPHQSLGELGDGVPWIGPHARQALEYADDGVAPPAVVNSMTLLSLETTAPVLLRAGIWPVHPFTHPDMIQLGEWLPFDWRELKQLQRRQLASLGLSNDVVQPVERESFAEVVRHALTTHAQPLFARMLREGSVLFDSGLVDPDALGQAVGRVGDGHYNENLDAKLLEVIHLHLAAEAFL